MFLRLLPHPGGPQGPPARGRGGTWLTPGGVTGCKCALGLIKGHWLGWGGGANSLVPSLCCGVPKGISPSEPGPWDPLRAQRAPVVYWLTPRALLLLSFLTVFLLVCFIHRIEPL